MASTPVTNGMPGHMPWGELGYVGIEISLARVTLGRCIATFKPKNLETDYEHQEARPERDPSRPRIGLGQPSRFSPL
jgi:hypothetical protein